MLMGAPVSWGSKKQSSVSLSTSEAEYIALSLAIQEGKWIHRLLCEIPGSCQRDGTRAHDPRRQPVVHQDDEEPSEHGRPSTSTSSYHHIRDEVKRGEVKARVLRYVSDAGGHHGRRRSRDLAHMA
ncbi:hypothetical protein Pcac1_g29420 [Phytophthora cactorum]|nr:hypothetical protein Pcac1_g29420 [Phytophthora cactorum]